MRKVMEVFQPSAVVLQCGADSLNGDRLGPFNLTLKGWLQSFLLIDTKLIYWHFVNIIIIFTGHGRCVEFLRDYNLPLMLLGGGGYAKIIKINLILFIFKLYAEKCCTLLDGNLPLINFKSI